MKSILVFIILLPFSAMCQFHNGFGHISVSLFGNEELGTIPGVSLAGGTLVGRNVTLGAGCDIYRFDKNKLQFAEAYIDTRAFFGGLNMAGPFIGAQPGVALFKNPAPNKELKPGFTVNFIAGYFLRFRREAGITASVGYGLLSFSQSGHYIRHNGVKMNLGLFF